MAFRFLARWCALFSVVATVGLASPASAASLPACKGGSASTKAPTSRPSLKSAHACHTAAANRGSGVRLDQVRKSRASRGTVSSRSSATPSGYHHLGAGTGGTWSGVAGRLEVVNSNVRLNTYDFVASRFMAKRDMGGGRIAWLEAGWAETGWAGQGRQHIYTYDTNTNSWQFYDQYKINAGDRVWLDVHTDGDNVWQAWLWWNNRWNLLTAQKLSLGTSAYIEQYVEVHVDARRAARIQVPQATMDNVQLRAARGGQSRYWREDVATVTDNSAQERASNFCLNWQTHFDTWSAGDCR